MLKVLYLANKLVENIFNDKKLDFFVSLKELFNDAERELNGRLSFKILS